MKNALSLLFCLSLFACSPKEKKVEQDQPLIPVQSVSQPLPQKGTVSYYQWVIKNQQPYEKNEHLKCFENIQGSMGNTSYSCYCFDDSRPMAVTGFYHDYMTSNDSDTFDVLNIEAFYYVTAKDDSYSIKMANGKQILNWVTEDGKQCLSDGDLIYAPVDDHVQKFRLIEKIYEDQLDYKRLQHYTPEYDLTKKTEKEYGGRCKTCPIGNYVDGICDHCGTASPEVSKEHHDKWDKQLKESGEYTCADCNGKGCRKCKYKGIKTPY